jgi:hypothetical protein
MFRLIWLLIIVIVIIFIGYSVYIVVDIFNHDENIKTNTKH